MPSLPNMETVSGIIHPLDAFYAEAGLHLPPYTQIDGEAVPEPYTTLLVHRNDMTPTLEKCHGQNIHLQVLRRWRKADEYFRDVALALAGTEHPAESGAIKFNLDLFRQTARDQTLADRL